MRDLLSYHTNIIYRILVFIGLLYLSGCSIQLVSNYDPRAVVEANEIVKKVERFYGELLETASDKRVYEAFKNRYIEIEVDLALLVFHNEIRGTLNDPSTKQAQIARDLWLDDKKKHQTNNTVKNITIKLHRKQFRRIFIAMIKDEEAKKDASSSILY